MIQGHQMEAFLETTSAKGPESEGPRSTEPGGGHGRDPGERLFAAERERD